MLADGEDCQSPSHNACLHQLLNCTTTSQTVNLESQIETPNPQHVVTMHHVLCTQHHINLWLMHSQQQQLPNVSRSGGVSSCTFCRVPCFSDFCYRLHEETVKVQPCSQLDQQQACESLHRTLTCMRCRYRCDL